MSFYRTYRPQIIDEIDNLAVREAVLRLLSKPLKDLPHAFLCMGPRGAGKTTTARLLAKLFNCEKPSARSGPCGTCDQCVSIEKGKNLDVMELDAASNRGIDEIRQIRDAISLAPVSGKYRIYIIDEVHMLTTEAFNALLKTLEEPPGHVVFILATTDPQKVPVTIQSRCVPIAFHRASIAELVNALKRIIVKESIVIDDPTLALIAQQVDGSFRDAVKALELLSFTKGPITSEMARVTLALGESGLAQQFLDQLKAKHTAETLALIGQVISKGQDIKLFTVECLRMLEAGMVGLVRETQKNSTLLCEYVDISRALSRAYSEMRSSALTHLPLELAVIEYCETLTAQVETKQPKASAAPELAKTVVKSAPEIAPAPVSVGVLTKEKLTEHWADIIAELKNHNHSISGVMRSTRPKGVSGDIVTIEAFFTFHKDKLSEPKTRDLLAMVLFKLFGEKVKVDIVLGKK